MCLSRRLCVNEYAMWVLYEIVRSGSQWGGSQSLRLKVPPFLGLWARACPPPTQGIRVAPPAAAAPALSRSRRLRAARVCTSGFIDVLLQSCPSPLTQSAEDSRAEIAGTLETWPGKVK